ncbi:hypothetical protein [Spirosoma agri]|uniref:Uncharacterized protein n=1 Tax=Spirosoma agri TaxID=1987381 RepID=A0A6M0IN20_9BACT|nr:hypothetical protein [Spirosoma agri]NEU68323.1 hypothetical protein [Spirosoma agri]
MTLSELARFTPGMQVDLRCRTAPTSIYYKGLPDGDRQRYTPSGPEVASIPYTLEGRVVGLETDNIPYLVLESRGEAAILATKRGKLTVIGTEMRLKTLHVPISAIVTAQRHA